MSTKWEDRKVRLTVAEAEEIAGRVVKQAMDLWINPEIARRRERGVIDDSFVLRRAQVIFDPDAMNAQVRLNGEVSGVMSGKSRRGRIEVGELLKEEDIEPIDIQLTDKDPNAGHVTFIQYEGRWFISYDFRRNAGRIAETIAAAREFLDGAASELEARRVRTFYELLFCAAELVARGELLEMPGRELIDSHKHEFISSRYNLWGKLGNTRPEYPSLLNRLSELRAPSRYLRGQFNFSDETATVMLKTAREALQRLEESAPKRYPSEKISQARQARRDPPTG